MNIKKGFLTWLLTEEGDWIRKRIRRYHPSRADRFGIGALCFLFGQFPLLLFLMLKVSIFSLVLFLPFTTIGIVLMDYAVYLE